MKSPRHLTRISSTLLTSLALVGCSSSPPVITAVSTLCTDTTRYHVTAAQKAAFAADQSTWEPLVSWLLGFNKVRDDECLKPGKGA